jgi:hypothetical protein
MKQNTYKLDDMMSKESRLFRKMIGSDFKNIKHAELKETFKVWNDTSNSIRNKMESDHTDMLQDMIDIMVANIVKQDFEKVFGISYIDFHQLYKRLLENKPEKLI